MKVQYIDISPCEAREVPRVMSSHNVEYHSLACVNWHDEYPYLPSVEVAMAHCGDALFIHYRVSEQSVRAVALRDQDAVWEDSCVEFFSQPNPDDGIYYNIECNCAGRLLLAAGASRSGRESAPASVTDSISRWSSLGSSPFEERVEPTEWQLALVVPAKVYFRHDVGTFAGLHIRGNVYKCGDRLTVPHFVSLFPIGTPSPDFHRPECFDTIDFE